MTLPQTFSQCSLPDLLQLTSPYSGEISWVSPRAEDPLAGSGFLYRYAALSCKPVPPTPLSIVVQHWGVLLAHSLRVVVVCASRPKKCVPLAYTVKKGQDALGPATRFVGHLAALILADQELLHAQDPYLLILGGYDFARRAIDVTLSSAHLTPVFTDRESLGLRVFEEVAGADADGFQRVLSCAERSALSYVVESMWGSAVFSSRLGPSARRSNPKASEFIFKTSSLSAFTRAFLLASTNWELLNSGGQVAHKTRREELRLLESVVKMSGMVHALRMAVEAQEEEGEEGVDVCLPGLQRLVDLDNLLFQAAAWRRAVYERIIGERGLQTGDLVAYTLENDRYYLGYRRSGAIQAAFSVWFGSPICMSS